MPLSLTDKDLPPLFHSADKSSQLAQRWFLHATRFRLLGLVAAAIFGLFVWRTAQSPADWAGVLAALSFALALLVEVYLLKFKPERTWYEGRAAAESVKTLTWRYVMRAHPFSAEQSAADVDKLFLKQLKNVLGVLRDVDLAHDAAVGKQITDAMRVVRAASLADRKVAYEEYRVADQQSWYSRKAKWNRARANHWTFAMLAIEAGGIGGGILKAVGTIQGDMLGLAGAIVAAMTAWLQTKQHQSLAAAYTVTALELASVRSQIEHQESEADWAMFVSDAEEAFSREHTLWKASRGVGSI